MPLLQVHGYFLVLEVSEIYYLFLNLLVAATSLMRFIYTTSRFVASSCRGPSITNIICRALA